MDFGFENISLLAGLLMINFTLALFQSFSLGLCLQSSIQPNPFKKIYAFGDSFTDTGNTNSSSGSQLTMPASNPPYGETFFHQPTNRYSDGRLVIDFVAQALSLPLLSPYRKQGADSTHGLNFAVAGSTAISYSFFVKNKMARDLTPESLDTQLSWFNQVLEDKGCIDYSTTPSECRGFFDDALIWVGEIGANDYNYSFGPSVSPNTIQQLALASVSEFLKALLNKGAKYLVVQGLPPTGCLTISMLAFSELNRDSLGCVRTANIQMYNHNEALKAILSQLRKEFPQVLIVYADYWHSYASIMQNAKEYGFKELFKACCGFGGGLYNFDGSKTCGSPFAKSCPNPSEYINWDGFHLTEAFYMSVANSFLYGTFSDPPFSSLLSRKLGSWDDASSISFI